MTIFCSPSVSLLRLAFWRSAISITKKPIAEGHAERIRQQSEKRNCWAVLCRNEQHGSGGYPIPLALVEGDSDIRGSIHDSFVVECRWGCKEE
jgi:hypothetical protein